MIVIMAGLPATGKSTLSRELAGRCAGIVLDKDILRSTLFPPQYLEYSSEQDDFCQSLLLETAAYLLRKHPALDIFLDGRTFSRDYQVERVIAAAAEMRTPWRIIECVCSEETARERLERDTGHLARNRDYGLYQRLKNEFETLREPKLVVDTDAPLEKCVDAAYAWLKS